MWNNNDLKEWINNFRWDRLPNRSDRAEQKSLLQGKEPMPDTSIRVDICAR